MRNADAPGGRPHLAPAISAGAAVALWDRFQAWADRASAERTEAAARKRPPPAAAPPEAADGEHDAAVALLRAAATRVDLPETVRLAEELRTRFPQRADGYAVGAKALRESRRFGEAEALLQDAMTRFPDDAWPLVESTWVAHLGGDREAAIQRAAQLRRRFPANQAGYRVAAVALRDSKRLDEIDTLLREAMTRFPDEEWPLVESVWAAYSSGVREAAIQRAKHLRERFPANPAGYRIAAVALRDSKRFDDAEALLQEAIPRFPGEAWGSAEAALAALGRGDWEAAIERAALLRAHFPMHETGYRVAIDALRRLDRLDEAEAIRRDAEARFPGAGWTAATT